MHSLELENTAPCSPLLLRRIDLRLQSKEGPNKLPFRARPLVRRAIERSAQAAGCGWAEGQQFQASTSPMPL